MMETAGKKTGLKQAWTIDFVGYQAVRRNRESSVKDTPLVQPEYQSDFQPINYFVKDVKDKNII